MNNINEFYITLLSDASSKYYQNSLSKFINKFPNEIDLKENDWSVGISEIYINDFIPNVYGEIYKNSFFLTIGKNEKNPNGLGTTFFPFVSHHPRCDWKADILPILLENISPNPGYIKKDVARSLIWEIHNFITNNANYSAAIANPKMVFDRFKHIEICTSTNNIRLYIPIQKTFTPSELLKQLFSQISNTKSHKEKITKTFEILVNSHLSLTAKTAMVLIYSDVIEPSYVGDNKLRVLNIVVKCPLQAHF